MGIGLEKYNKILNITTQKGVHTSVYPIQKRYFVDNLDLHHNWLGGKWFFDWIPAKTKSIIKWTGSWVYKNGSFSKFYPKEANKSIPTSETLQDFCDDIGTPKHLKSDRTLEICV